MCKAPLHFLTEIFISYLHFYNNYLYLIKDFTQGKEIEGKVKLLAAYHFS